MTLGRFRALRLACRRLVLGLLRFAVTERGFALVVLILAIFTLTLLLSYRARTAQISVMVTTSKFEMVTSPKAELFPAVASFLSFPGQISATSVANLSSTDSLDLTGLHHTSAGPIRLSTNGTFTLPEIPLTQSQSISFDVPQRGLSVVTLTGSTKLDLLLRGHGYVAVEEGDQVSRTPIDLEVPAALSVSSKRDDPAIPLVITLSTPIGTALCRADDSQTSRAPIVTDVPIQRISFTRELLPGGLSNQSGILTGRIKILDDGSEIALSQLDSVQMAIRSGTVRRVYLDDCDIRVQMDATVAALSTGIGSAKVTRMPTLLGEIVFQRNSNLLFIALLAVWGFLWSARSLFVKEES